MKKLIIILSAAAIIASGFGLISKKQSKTVISQTVTIEDFIGKWLYENIIDLDADLFNYRFELYLEKDKTKENTLKGWHCVYKRGGRQIDCDDYNDEAPIHGYLKNDTVFLHFINNWDDAVEAKLYFGKSNQNLSTIIWELVRYEPKLQPFFTEKDTLQKVTKEIKQ